MPIAVTCSCGKPIKAPDAAAGKRVRCPHCQQIVEVPGKANTSATKPAAKPAAGAAGAAKESANLVWLGIGAALSVGVLAAVVWFAARSLNSGGDARADLAGSKEKPAPPPVTPAPGSGPSAPDSGPPIDPPEPENNDPPKKASSSDQEPTPRRARNRGNGPRGTPPGAMPPGFPGGPGGPFGGPGGPFGGPGGPPAPPREPAQPPDPSLPSYDGFWEGTATVSKEPDHPVGPPLPPLSLSLAIDKNIIRAITINQTDPALPPHMPPHTELVKGPVSLSKNAAGLGTFVAHAGPSNGFVPPGVLVPLIVVTGSFVDSTTATGTIHFDHLADSRMRQHMPEFAWTMTRPKPNGPAGAAPDAAAGGAEMVDPMALTGTWRGTTAEGYRFDFTVDNGVVTSMIVGYRVPGVQETRLLRKEDGLGAITAGGRPVEFSLVDAFTAIDPNEQFGRQRNGTLRIVGSFPSNTAAKGTIEVAIDGQVGFKSAWSAVLKDRATAPLEWEPDPPEKARKKPKGEAPEQPARPAAAEGSVAELLRAIDDITAFANLDGNSTRADIFIALVSSPVRGAVQRVQQEKREREAFDFVFEKWRLSRQNFLAMRWEHFNAIQALEGLGEAALPALPEFEEALKDKNYRAKEIIKDLVVSLRKLDKAAKTRAKAEARKAELAEKAAAGENADDDSPESDEGDTNENQAAAKLKNVRQFLEKNDQGQARKYAKQILERFPETSAAKEARAILDEIGDE